MNGYPDAIRAAFPSLRIVSAEALSHEGQHSDILLVNGDLIFRFPRYEDGLPALRDEVAVLEAVAERLPLPVPRPLYVALDARAGRPFVGYRRLPGRPLARTELAYASAEQRRAWGAQMGAFLKALHATPPHGLDVLARG